MSPHYKNRIGDKFVLNVINITIPTITLMLSQNFAASRGKGHILAFICIIINPQSAPRGQGLALADITKVKILEVGGVDEHIGGSRLKVGHFLNWL